MPRALACVLIALGTGCGDSTDIAGTYEGAAIYQASVTMPMTDSLGGAEPLEIVVQDGSDDSVTVTIGECSLEFARGNERTVTNYGEYDDFVFTSDVLASSQMCQLALSQGSLAFGASTGELVVNYGGKMSLDISGDIVSAQNAVASAGYFALMYSGHD